MGIASPALLTRFSESCAISPFRLLYRACPTGPVLHGFEGCELLEIVAPASPLSNPSNPATFGFQRASWGHWADRGPPSVQCSPNPTVQHSVGIPRGFGRTLLAPFRPCRPCGKVAPISTARNASARPTEHRRTKPSFQLAGLRRGVVTSSQRPAERRCI